MPSEPSRKAQGQHLPSTIGDAGIGDAGIGDAGRQEGEAWLSDGGGQLVEILDAYLADLRAGKVISGSDLIARHPELAEQLEACLAGLEFIHQTEANVGESPQRLGDFRLIREVGRGGMGVVYEAEQLSLQRRVAVKVLRFGAVSDPEAVDRFQREAETVARLHHTNIVPIFFVGIENGVNYFAMEFIEGRSLADVLAQTGGPIDATTVIDWGCQVADALAHAHQRGVIHRDIKPSNLLLDEEGQIWLTDFGLAKRLDDVTLSLTGALLGTPRYMSPEQASAARHRLDHRTDLYSLGATLYELMTGQPVFSADTPHQVIDQILNREPTPPRRINPTLSRDIETILLKCLGKEPERRYQSARALADDLRAVLEGRQIGARRASPRERVWKWVRRHRRSLTLTAGSVAATAALLLITLVASLWYRRQQLVPLTLVTDQPPLAAEIRHLSGRLRVTQTVPTQEPVQVPAGDYQIQVSGKGRLSETYQVQLERGESPRFDLHLDESLVGPPLTIDRSYQLVETKKGTLTITLDDNGLHCFDMSSGTLRWVISLRDSEQPSLATLPGWIWPWSRLQRSNVYSGWGDFDLRPYVVGMNDDINQDGEEDILIANRHQACLFAVSGKNGELLWVAARGDDLGKAIDNSIVRFDQQGVVSSVVATPTTCGDMDEDGTVDYAVLLVETSDQKVRRSLELISGKTGQTLWQRDLEDRWFNATAGLDVPTGYRWFVGSGAATSQMGGNPGSDSRGVIKREPSRLERVGYFHHVPSPPVVASWHGGRTQPPRLTLLAGSHLLSFDPATGAPMETPMDCGFKPGRAPTLADLDGDGADELVLMEDLAAQGTPGGFLQNPKVRIGVFSLSQRDLLWTRDVEAGWPHTDWPHFPIAPANWPRVVDLDGDGRSELIVPNGTSLAMGHLEQAWGEIEVLDAMTGQPRWRRRLKTMDQQLDRFLPGPDIDGDGFAEVFVTTLWSSDFVLYVDAISGRDGHSLWAGKQNLGKTNQRIRYRLGEPLWWNAGTDGWPQLVVPVTPEDTATEPLIHFFSAGTGSLMRVASNLIGLLAQDVDGDEIDDLFAFEPNSPSAIDQGGTLICSRGQPIELWNHFGKQWAVTTDLDADGVRDLTSVSPDGSVIAASSRDGNVLWKAQLPRQNPYQLKVVAALPRLNGFLGPGALLDSFMLENDSQSVKQSSTTTGDLNRDGTGDLLVYASGFGRDQPFSPLVALSGMTGRTLWSAEIQAMHVAGVHALDTRDLDGDGSAEVIWVGASDWMFPENRAFTIHQKQIRLAVLSGQDGRLIWQKPLTKQFGATPQTNTAPTEMDHGWVALSYGDVNNDGIVDLIIPADGDAAAGASVQHLKAFSGKSGELLWSSPLPAARDSNRALSDIPPTLVADLDGDSQPEVVTLAFESESESDSMQAELRVLEGQDGRERWRRHEDVSPECGTLAADGQSVRYRPRPLLLRSEDQQPLLCLNLWDTPERVLVVDRFGKEVADFRLETERGYHRRQFRVWAFDTNGDGNDEILLTNHDRIMAIRPRQPEQIRWQHEVIHLWTDEIEGILPRNQERGPQIVVRRVTSPSSVYGLDATTGSKLWTVPAPSPLRRGNTVLVAPSDTALLHPMTDSQPASLFFQHGEVSRVREAVRLNRGESRRGQDQDLTLVSRVPASRSTTDDDPRFQRPLPWIPPDFDPARLLERCSWAAFYSLSLVYLPGVFVVHCFRRRRWSLRWLGMLPLVAAIALSAILIDVPDLPGRGFEAKFVLAILALPGLLLISRFVVLAWQRRWRPVVTWLAVTLITSTALAAISLAISQFDEQMALQSGERYAWKGWWLIPLYGAYLMAFVWMVTVLFTWAARRAIALLRHRRRIQGVC